jgi:hypothetical protein
MRKTTAALTSALVLTAMSTTALARDEDMTGLTCDDIVYQYRATAQRSDVTAEDIDRACRDVVEMDGKKYAKLKVELDRVSGNNATFHFVMPDGSAGKRHSITVAPEWRTEIGGREYRMRELNRGQELNVYIPADRIVAHIVDNQESINTYTPVPIESVDDGMSGGSSASLPATAGALPLFGLFGGIALFGASLIRIFRRS